MPKLIYTVDIPDEKFNPAHYPDLDNPSPIDMLDWDVQAMHDGISSESELLDNFLESGGVLEVETLTSAMP